MSYDGVNKKAMIYLDGRPETVPTSFNSPLIFNSKRLRIGDNEFHGMGLNGGITDVRIWTQALSQETIKSLAAGHKSLVPAVIKALNDLGRKDIMVVVGGVIPKKDYDILFNDGVAAIFGPGTNISNAAQDIIKIMIEGYEEK